MDEFQVEQETVEEKPQRKRRSRGFGQEAEAQSLEVQETMNELTPEIEEQIEVEQTPVESIASAPKRHVPLVRPMTPKKAVPQRGIKGASRVRP